MVSSSHWWLLALCRSRITQENRALNDIQIEMCKVVARTSTIEEARCLTISTCQSCQGLINSSGSKYRSLSTGTTSLAWLVRCLETHLQSSIMRIQQTESSRWSSNSCVRIMCFLLMKSLCLAPKVCPVMILKQCQTQATLLKTWLWICTPTSSCLLSL